MWFFRPRSASDPARRICPSNSNHLDRFRLRIFSKPSRHRLCKGLACDYAAVAEVPAAHPSFPPFASWCSGRRHNSVRDVRPSFQQGKCYFGSNFCSVIHQPRPNLAAQHDGNGSLEWSFNHYSSEHHRRFTQIAKRQSGNLHQCFSLAILNACSQFPQFSGVQLLQRRRHPVWRRRPARRILPQDEARLAYEPASGFRRT